MTYNEAVEKYNFQIGDYVTLTRKIEGNQSGWTAGWGGGMDQYVGRSGTINKIDHPVGIHITFGYGERPDIYWPAQILVPKEKPYSPIGPLGVRKKKKRLV